MTTRSKPGVVGREPEIALVLSAESWVDALHRHCADHGGVRVRSMVLDPQVALDEDFDVLVTGERWPPLTRAFVDALHLRGRRVLVVTDPAGAADVRARLEVDRVVDVGASPSEIVATVLELVPFSSDAVAAHGPSADARGPDGSEMARPFVAVGGPSGAGSTEVAITLAGLSARQGRRAVLVDADQVTPSVAVRLGLPLEPNLCTAVDAAAYGLGAVPGALFDLGEGWPVVLVGAPNRRAGEALTGRDVLAVGDVLAERFSPVYFDVSAGTSDVGDEDVRAAIVARAAAVVAVGSGNPVGVVRLGEWLGWQHGDGNARVHVVVNRAPSARGRRAELAGELQRGRGIAGLTFAPTDPRVEDAGWSAAIVERGPFVRAVERVHEIVAGRVAVGGETASWGSAGAA